MLPRIRLHRLVPDDIFISYSRRDASAYSDGLAAALLERKFSVWLDRLGSLAGDTVPEDVVERAKKCQMLVVVGTPGAAGSPEVMREVHEYVASRGSDRVVPIDFSGALRAAQWYSAVRGLAPEAEEEAALTGGKPSSRVINRIVQAYVYQRRSRRLAQYTTIIGGLLLALLIASGGAAVLAYQQTNKAVAAATRAKEAQEAVAKQEKLAQDARNETQIALDDATKQQDLANQRANEAQRAGRRAELSRQQPLDTAWRPVYRDAVNATELTEDLKAQRLQLMLDELKPSWTFVELQQLLVDLDDGRGDPEDDAPNQV